MLICQKWQRELEMNEPLLKIFSNYFTRAYKFSIKSAVEGLNVAYQIFG